MFWDPLLRANWSMNLVHIAGSSSDLFPVHVGLLQGCPLSSGLFIIFMDRISSQGPEEVQFGDHWISSLFFVNDIPVCSFKPRPSGVDCSKM